MSKVLIENSIDNTTVPFLRGILVRSLQDIGLEFELARGIANQIRNELNAFDRISTEQLEQKVLDKLAELDDGKTCRRYAERGIPSIALVRGDDGQLLEFSRSEYRLNLEAIGLRHDEALEIVRAVSAHLSKHRQRTVSANYIARFTYRLLRKSKHLGPAVARRWLIWRDFVNSGRPLVLLLGGTAGSGKSAVAAEITSRLNIVRTTSTDMLREVMRSIISQKSQPLLHESSFTAWTALAQSDSRADAPTEALVKGYTTQAEIVSTAIDAVIQRAAREGVSLVVEGIHIHPPTIDNMEKLYDAVMVPVMLAVLKPETLRRRIRGRSADVPQRRAEHYLNHFDAIWALQSHLLTEADQAGVPIIVNEDREEVFREIMLITLDTLGQGFEKTAEQVFSRE